MLQRFYHLQVQYDTKQIAIWKVEENPYGLISDEKVIYALLHPTGYPFVLSS